jgi:hypothetical protein
MSLLALIGRSAVAVRIVNQAVLGMPTPPWQIPISGDFGLVIMFPLIGHATWHAFRNLVERGDGS